MKNGSERGRGRVTPRSIMIDTPPHTMTLPPHAATQQLNGDVHPDAGWAKAKRQRNKGRHPARQCMFVDHNRAPRSFYKAKNENRETKNEKQRMGHG